MKKVNYIKSILKMELDIIRYYMDLIILILKNKIKMNKYS